MYNKLIREGLINSSVAEVLFGDEFNREIALMSDMLPKTVHEVCLFLLYLSAGLRNRGCAQKGCYGNRA